MKTDGARIQIDRKCGFLLEPAPYKVLYGGRGGGKSYSMARALLVLAAQQKKRILCTREFQNSIKDSVHYLLKSQIDLFDLNRIFSVKETTIKAVNGSEFIFAGLSRNISSIKSTEGIDIAWVEEGQTISKESWEVLDPTIRKGGSEIWVSFNPKKDTDVMYSVFVINKPPKGAVVKKILWSDNRFITQDLLRKKDHMYSVDPSAARHVWGGETLKYTDAQVLHDKWVIGDFDPKPDWDGPYFGADWGYSKDPTTLVKCWAYKNILYVEHEAYGVGVELDEVPSLFGSVPGSKKHTIRADSSRPDTISHVKSKGFPLLVGCEKGKGSVEDGVAHLRSYEKIVIHPRCKHAIDEASLWSWKVDKSGDILPILIDKHNHIMDGLRYALEPLIKIKQDFFLI